MAEKITLNSPIKLQDKGSIELVSLNIDIRNKIISITWLWNDGEYGTANYTTPPPDNSSQPSGATLIAGLNTANLTSNSLVKRVFSRLQADGYIPAGTISGTPD